MKPRTLREFLPSGILKGCCAGFGYGVILFAGTTADADSAYDFAIFLQRNAAGEDHDFAVVGDVDAEELVARLAVLGQVLRGDVERTGRPRLTGCARNRKVAGVAVGLTAVNRP